MQGHQIKEEEGQMPLHMMLPVSLSKAVDEYRFAAKEKSRTKAVRSLLTMGLAFWNRENGKKK